MAAIRYISLSDLHLGADNSILTRLSGLPQRRDPEAESQVDPLQPSAVLTALAACVRELAALNGSGRKPRLILNGDLLELALANDNNAAMAFERLLEILFPEGQPLLFRRNIIFIPGNHDHHLWETARELQYVKYLKKMPLGLKLQKTWHTTRMFRPAAITASVLNGVIERHPYLKRHGLFVRVVYPNLGVLSRDGGKLVIFTHGHYIEPVYTLMSRIRDALFPPKKGTGLRIAKQTKDLAIWTIEEENFAWIDFFWSTMGRSGTVGRDIEHLYDMLLSPATQDELIDLFAAAVARKLGHGNPVRAALLAFGSWYLFSALLHRMGGFEKTKTGEPLSAEAYAGLLSYVEGPLHEQVVREKPHSSPRQTSLVFGHTHKPFSRQISFDGFPSTAVFNSGGWVVDTSDADPAHGGAIVVVDDEFNVVSLRMYNEQTDDRPGAVCVESLASGAALRDRLKQLLTASPV